MWHLSPFVFGFGDFLAVFITIISFLISFSQFRIQIKNVKEDIEKSNLKKIKRDALHDYALKVLWKKVMTDMDFPNNIGEDK
jgi:hypothetical protein